MDGCSGGSGALHRRSVGGCDMAGVPSANKTDKIIPVLRLCKWGGC